MSSNLSAVAADSQAYGFLEYFLRLSLHTTTTRIVDAHEVSNPQLTVQFERRARDTLTLDAWVDTAAIDEADVLAKGVALSGAAGMTFNVGRLALAPAADEPVVRRRLLLCKIAVGRAYNATEDFARIATVPDGYDSFVVEGAAHGGEGCDAAALTYVLKDGAQVLPTYVVVMEHSPEMERLSRQRAQCDNCEAAPATVYCQADAASLCAACDATLHASKLAARHVRLALDAGAQTFSACRQHPDKVVEFFCPACSRPVCVHCKMVGHHSTGDAARHKLISVAEAFRAVSEAAGAADPLLEARKQRIGAQIAAVRERQAAVEANAGDVQAQLEDVYKRALLELKSLTKKKLNVLRGDMVELEREAGEIAQLEAFLAYVRAGGNAAATQFIADWGFHQKLRAELHAFPHFRESIDVLPDMRVAGALQVHVDAAQGGTAGALHAAMAEGRSRYGTGMSAVTSMVAGTSLAGGPSSTRLSGGAADFCALTKGNKARATPAAVAAGIEQAKAAEGSVRS